jgi:hypothetical protein
MAVPAAAARIEGQPYLHDFTRLFPRSMSWQRIWQRDYLQRMLSFKREFLLMG